MSRDAKIILTLLTLAVLLACLIAVTVKAKVYMSETRDMAARLEAMKLELAEVRKSMDETKEMITEYTAVASWYGPGFHGRTAADGSVYNQDAYTIAHKTLPFGTIVVLEYHGKRVPAMVTDRGPYYPGSDFDLSLGLAKKLGLMTKGVDQIKVYQLDVEAIR